MRTTFQILAVLVQRRQNLARMYRFHQMITAKRLTHQNAQILFARQIGDCLDATRRSSVLAEQLKEAGIRFGNENLWADIRRFAAVLDFDGLCENLVLFAGVQEECRTLQGWIGQCGNAEIVVLTLDDLGDGREFGFCEIPVRIWMCNFPSVYNMALKRLERPFSMNIILMINDYDLIKR